MSDSLNGVFPSWFYTKEYQIGVWLGFAMGLGAYHYFVK